MSQLENSAVKNLTLAFGSFLVISLLGPGSASTWSQNRTKPEKAEATARGTEAASGSEFEVTLIIYRYSPGAERQVLVDAFQNGKDQGLYNALSKMKAVGHIAVAGAAGIDVSYIEMTPTPSGRKIRFVTNRPLRIGETYRDSQSVSYNLTAGELDLNDEDKSKSTGLFYPEARFAIDKQGKLQINLIGFPWKFVDVIDWRRSHGSD